jgi:hypothetical protein
MKPFLGKVRPKGWGKGAPKGNTRATGRKTSRPFATRHDRGEEVPPSITRRGKRDYLYANCVVLAAAIFAEPWAKQWAEDLLPGARRLDGRNVK